MSMYPFLYPFITVDRWLSYLKHCLKWSDQDVEFGQKLLERNLIPLISGVEIAQYLGISSKLVGRMAIAPNRYYRPFNIKKKSGENREITAPRVFLKTVQRYVLDCILTPFNPHPAAIGFVRGRAIAMGAALHVGQPYIWNIDLKDFFPSISQQKVRSAFENMGYPSTAAYLLSGLCCLNGALPQGAPTSPALTNYIFTPLDELIAALAQKNDVVYTRYADDFTYSSQKPMTAQFQHEVTTLLKDHGFEINNSKTRLMGRRCRREVTGLTVNVRISIPRTKRRRLRAMFHHVALNPSACTEKKNQLLGYASWISQYHQEEAQRYRLIISKI